MGITSSKVLSYLPFNGASSTVTGGHEDQPTCDPKNVDYGQQQHTNESGDEEDAQEQDGGNLDGNNDKEEPDEEENLKSRASVSKDKNERGEDCAKSANGAGDSSESETKPEDGLKNRQHQNDENGDKMDEDSNEPVVINVINGDSKAKTPIKEAGRDQEHAKSHAATASEYRSALEQAKAAYVARKNGEHLILSRPSQLTVESRKRDHSADSERSNPSYPTNYLNDLPIANRNKRQKSSETDSVSSSRSDRASTEMEQITPKVAKSRKRRAKPSKKYIS